MYSESHWPEFFRGADRVGASVGEIEPQLQRLTKFEPGRCTGGSLQYSETDGTSLLPNHAGRYVDRIRNGIDQYRERVFKAYLNPYAGLFIVSIRS